jgi:hypothetical protein
MSRNILASFQNRGGSVLCIPNGVSLMRDFCSPFGIARAVARLSRSVLNLSACLLLRIDFSFNVWFS